MPLKDELTKEQVQAILNALDETIATGPWEESAFLRVIGKNLREIRDNFSKELAREGVQTSLNDRLSSPLKAPSSEQQEVFVSLYSAEGKNIQAWERILGNLPKQMISRPIYAEEINIQNIIKSKENKLNEAYVVIYVEKNDILALPSDKRAVDKLGKSLLSLKDRSLKLENIVRFIHVTGSYRYQKGHLIKDDSLAS